MLNRDKSLSSNVRTGQGRILSIAPDTAPYGASRTAPPQVAEPAGNYDTGPDHQEESQAINGKPSRHLGSQRYSWAWKHYLNACASYWLPEQIDLEADIRQWQDADALSLDERAMLENSLAFMHLSKHQLADHGVNGIYRHITNAECRQYLLRQTFEQGLHRHATWHAVTSLGLARHEQLIRPSQTSLQKAHWLNRLLAPLNDAQFNTGSVAQAQHLLCALVASYLLFQGMFLQTATVQLMSLSRRDKMCGTSRLLRHMLRDQTRQMLFGADLVNQIRIENPHLWDAALREQLSGLVREAVALETRSVFETLPRGLLGLNAPMLEEYLQFLANRRCAQIGLDILFPEATNPFPWLDAQTETCQQGTPSHTGKKPACGPLDWNH